MVSTSYQCGQQSPSLAGLCLEDQHLSLSISSSGLSLPPEPMNKVVPSCNSDKWGGWCPHTSSQGCYSPPPLCTESWPLPRCPPEQQAAGPAPASSSQHRGPLPASLTCSCLMASQAPGFTPASLAAPPWLPFWLLPCLSLYAEGPRVLLSAFFSIM